MTPRRPLRLGVRLPNSGPFATAENILATAEHVERSGYDMVWVHDHISWAREKLTHFATGSNEACRDQDPNFYESITTAAVLGGRLRRVTIGIAGLVLPLRDPRVLAKQVTAIERLTGSRLLLAFGIGAIPGDFDIMGVRFDKRGRLMNEHLGALRAIFGEAQPVSYSSPSVTFTDGTFYPRPVRLPLWVTGGSDAGLERAAKYADGWMTVYASVSEYGDDVKRLGEFAAKAGREVDTLDSGYETYVTVARTHEEALRIARASLVDKFKTLERGLEVCIVGSVDEVMARIDQYHEAGAGTLELKFICHDVGQLREMIEMVAAARGTLATA
jgi:alkanesulfonate monooxygenase SsuD/methylene tetrahydromethanopterin reductase-like flavin-dependent oxidoreductase (luciferase family)